MVGFVGLATGPQTIWFLTKGYPKLVAAQLGTAEAIHFLSADEWLTETAAVVDSSWLRLDKSSMRVHDHL